MFQKILFSVVAFAVTLAGYSQQKRAVAPSEGDPIICSFDEPQPEFPGGHKTMLKYLSKNLAYPEAAARAKVQGKVFLSFLIDETDKLSEIKILKGIGYGCDEEAIRLTKLMPPWKPGRQNGKPVAIRYQLPIRFVLPVAGKKPAEK